MIMTDDAVVSELKNRWKSYDDCLMYTAQGYNVPRSIPSGSSFNVHFLRSYPPLLVSFYPAP